ncbi:MAG TPA: ABC transporter permease [Candidatus Limnocylindrales bacterium]|nr:ABC transporter permease [Candidatus Limnocylindrales bacterium]
MNWLRVLARRLGATFSHQRPDCELDEELQSHLEMLVAQNVQRGMTPAEARCQAHQELGGIDQIKESAQDQRGLPLLESLWQDIRYAVRVLRKSPSFTTVAILTLALGIGANTAIFSLIDTVMLRLLPVKHPEELVQVGMLTPHFSNGRRTSYTNPLWEALRDNQDVFSGVFAWGDAPFNLANGGVVQDVRGVFVSGDYFPALGVRPAAGRLLAPSDDKRGCQGAAVLSYGFWQEHFGGAPSAVGGTLPIEGHPFQIVGISAPGFFGTEVGQTFDVALPICAEAVLQGKNSSLDQKANWWFHVMARSKAGLTPGQVSARLAVLSPQIFASAVPANWKPSQQQSFRSWQFITLPGATGLSQLRRDYDVPLRILMAIAGLVLLIACANIASLMLARAASRRREIAVRLALGASRLRLIRQLLTECIILSVSGAALGVLVARWSSRLLVRYISTTHNQIYLDVALDARVLAFTAAVAILTGLLFGILPALRATRVSIGGAMKGVASEATPHDTRFRSGRWVVATQVAFSLVLVITAALFLRSFAKLATLDAGFDRNNVLIADVGLHDPSVPGPVTNALTDNILRRVRALPGVVSASIAVTTPVSGHSWDDQIVVEGKNAPTGEDSDVDMNYVAPQYFATLHTRLLEGRDFTEHDVADVPRVAVVNQALARKFFPGADALGKTFRRYATTTTLGDPIEIVGVVQDAKYDSLREDFPPIAYFPFAELPMPLERWGLVIRTTTRPSALARSVEETLTDADKSVAIEFHTLAQQVDDSMVQERLLATLSGFFGALALLLAMIGLYGVLAYLVLQRQKEIGIRMALGAQRSSIVRLVLGDVAILLAVGVAAGVAMSWATARFVQGLLFGLQARDAGTIALGIGLLVAVAMVAAYLPARRATRVDPMRALRYE